MALTELRGWLMNTAVKLGLAEDWFRVLMLAEGYLLTDIHNMPKALT